MINKISAATRTLTIPVGQTVKIGTLSVTVQACVVRPPNMPGDAAAFLSITGGPTPFARWNLRSEPALAMFQDPIYSLRVRGCAA